MSAPEKTALVRHETMFEGQRLDSYDFHGRRCWIAADVGRVIGYADGGKRLADVVRDDWSEEMIAGRDFEVLTGKDLADFKELLVDTQERWVSKTRRMMVLYESGLHFVCVKTEKPLGKRLRRFLVDEVLPKLRRGEPILPPQVTLDDAIEALPPEERTNLGGRRPIDVAPPALPAPAEPAQPLERNLARALLLLGPRLDPRLRSALIASTPPARPTVEHYLQLAATLTEILPGVVMAHPSRSSSAEWPSHSALTRLTS